MLATKHHRISTKPLTSKHHRIRLITVVGKPSLPNRVINLLIPLNRHALVGGTCIPILFDQYNGSSYNSIYGDTLEQLSIQQLNLSLYDGRDLLAFNDSVKCPYGSTNLKLSLGEGEDMRMLGYHSS